MPLASQVKVLCMTSRSFLLALTLGLGLAASGVAAAGPLPRQQDQEAAYKARQQGRIMPLRAIEARVLPQMRGWDYLGPELDGGAARYRLKFMRSGRVVWIDVDARTGDVIGRSGN